ncbi:MAG: MFS transporter [Rhodobacteraceae bacterium]|nr:MFS transporter [Paracoccaceae bacterium]MBT4284957.1 MFS transporter [Paracoccaceae bacterium]MBT4776913.1 MFS transporter [Paracoccaceae bacterium]MBT6437265.1 MFS transporter [Paracoccaceae bacterium]|tara:strand:+ start:17909 stop:19144 length:1236 start_codon:yes stop_codon:yes gene_type:complete
MSSANSFFKNDPRTRRNVIVLIIAQATLGCQMPMMFVVGGLAGNMLSTNPCLATLPISLIVFGSMMTAPWLSALMQRRGRRIGLMVGACGGALGASIAAIGLLNASFGLLLVGSLFSGIYMSAQGFYRFTVADSASDESRPKAISYVMAGGLLSAIFGPQLNNLLQGTTSTQFLGSYLAIIVLNIIGLFLFFALDLPKTIADKAKLTTEKVRSRLEILKTPRIVAIMICGLVSYCLMNLVMTSTPLAVVGCGFTQTQANNVVSTHVLAMFIPSFFTGHLIVRFGAEKIIAIGLIILAFSGVTAFLGVDLMNFYFALALLGVGWNFGFIGATTLISSSHNKSERGVVQGTNDFIIFGSVTLASLTSGGLMNCSGGSPQEGWSTVSLAMIPMLILAGIALTWLIMNKRVSAPV